jgi:peptidoglycan/xylan/chitin deacetylase (PgdA/CDA1 family)
MKHAISAAAKTVGRPLKRVVETVIDNRLVDYHMPVRMRGDLLITFDDGPDPVRSPRILDVLERYGAKALFFVIGERAATQPGHLRAYVDRGHMIANHTYTHLDDGRGGRYSRERVAEDIRRCADLVERMTGVRTAHFRPPRGELNLKTLGAARETGHRLMLWSIEGGEWGKRSDWSAEDISAYVCNNVSRRDILVLHDDNDKSLVVIDDLLSRLSAAGYDMASAVQSLKD